MTKKNELDPVNVPWMVSPSVSALKIEVNENRDAIVCFDAAYLLSENGSIEELQNKRVEIRFHFGQWIRIAPAYSDTHTIPPNLFEVSNSDLSVIPAGESSDYPIGFRKNWAKTGNCPNPYFYQVQNSEWLIASGAKRFGCKHYVLAGHDMWLEILCSHISWRWSDSNCRVT